MRVVIEKGRAYGSITAPPSKSICHRMIIAAAMCRGESVLSGISLCEDCLATIDCLRALGVKMILDGDVLTVRGCDGLKPSGILNCRESGSTLRFLIPLALLSGERTRFVGTERLLERPQTVYEDLAKERGFVFQRDKDGITVEGRLESGEYSVAGNVSSQFITGLLFALSKCEGDSRIIITTDIESRSYIDLTMDAMHSFGAEVSWEEDNIIFIRGGAKYEARDLRIEGDYSGTAFIEALNLFGGDVKVSGLNDNSLQGDRVYQTHFKRMKDLPIAMSIKDCPDLGPIFFAAAAGKRGGFFTDTARLRIKESDRAEAMAEELRKFGAEVYVSDNFVRIDAVKLHSPAEVLKGHNDHRIVMALSVLLTVYGGQIDGAEAVSKSYGGFFDDLEKLNIRIKKYEI